MPFSVAIPVILRPTEVDLTFVVELVDRDGAVVEQPEGVTVEHGEGHYTWISDAIPNGFVGGVRFYTGTDFRAASAINETDQADQIAQSMWDQLVAAHQIDGSFGESFFEIYNATQRIGSVEVLVTSPVADNKSVTIVAGDDYKEEHNRALVFENVEGWPTLTDSTPISFTGGHGKSLFAATGRVVLPAAGSTDPVRIIVEIEGEQTKHVLPNKPYGYGLRAQIGTDLVTLVRGPLRVLEGFNL